MSPLDRLLSEPGDAGLYPLLAGTSAPHRAEFRERLTDRERTVLGQYGFRSAITALRDHSAARLRVGLIATALTLTDEDPRDIMVNMAVPYHVAQQLGLLPADVFDEAASYAGPDTAEVLRTFGRRTDVTLEAFGWRQIDTPDGPDVAWS